MEHTLDRLGGILGGVAAVLEGGVQVAPLDDVERVLVLLEQPADRGPRQPVCLVLEVVDSLQRARQCPSSNPAR